MGLQELFYPRSVAVIGSVAEGKLGCVLIRGLLESGFKDIYAINLTAQGVDQIPGFRSVQETGAAVDLAVIVSPAATVRSVMEDCGRAGVRAAVVITSGFAEAGNPAGEEELKQVARHYGIRFVGPNCAGILNMQHNLVVTLEAKPLKGSIALVSQSGGIGGLVMSSARERGLGFSKFVSYGNGADINVIELLCYLKDDPETRAVALYVENVKDGREFIKALQELSREKPVVIIKSGRTGTGQRAALSHTGSMAGSDAVYDAAFRESGALRVESVEEMLDLCQGLATLPLLKGRRLAIIGNSGGFGVLAADKAEEVGLEVAEPGPGLKEKLRAFLPSHASIQNPVDLTVEGTAASYRQALSAALGEYDAALALYIGTPYLEAIPYAASIVKAAEESQKPVAVSLAVGSDISGSLKLLQEHGLPNFSSGERAARALGRIADYGQYRAGLRPLPSLPEALGGLPPGSGHLLETEAMQWLKENGLPVPEFCFAVGHTEAVAACRRLGYPVVMKVVSPEIIHKSDHGGVVLDIDSDSAAGAAFDRIQASARGKDFRGVVIYPMLKGGREVILGLTRDPQFGPVVVFGLGGIYTEVLQDIALRVAPVDSAGAMEMIRSIRALPLLQGLRGQEPVDLESLADALARFSRLPFLYPEVQEVDLNPVFVFPDRLVIGDARVICGRRTE
jgi:acyl-CoA synthetase (NDP forming)